MPCQKQTVSDPDLQQMKTMLLAQELLQTHKVDLNKFGKGNAKTLLDRSAEIINPSTPKP